MIEREDMPERGRPALPETLLRRQIASLRLVEPLMLAALHRPGISESVPLEEIVKAQQTLIYRTIHLADNILERLEENSLKRPFDRYTVAREIVGLVSAHWRSGSDLTAQDMTVLAEQATASGMQLMHDLKEQPYQAGDDAAERLSSAVSASAKIMLSMRSQATLGHDLISLCRKMTEHLGATVVAQADRLRARDSAPAVKALIRVYSDYYPLLWAEEIRAAVAKFRALKDNPDEFKRETERLQVWPLEGFFARIEDAVSGCMDMAAGMQLLLEETASLNNSTPQP